MQITSSSYLLNALKYHFLCCKKHTIMLLVQHPIPTPIYTEPLTAQITAAPPQKLERNDSATRIVELSRPEAESVGSEKAPAPVYNRLSVALTEFVPSWEITNFSLLPSLIIYSLPRSPLPTNVLKTSSSQLRSHSHSLAPPPPLSDMLNAFPWQERVNWQSCVNFFKCRRAAERGQVRTGIGGFKWAVHFSVRHFVAFCVCNQERSPISLRW